jgi:hypothetical protein
LFLSQTAAALLLFAIRHLRLLYVTSSNNSIVNAFRKKLFSVKNFSVDRLTNRELLGKQHSRNKTTSLKLNKQRLLVFDWNKRSPLAVVANVALHQANVAVEPMLRALLLLQRSLFKSEPSPPLSLALL